MISLIEYKNNNVSLKKAILERQDFLSYSRHTNVSENSPKPLAVESCLACNPGGEPACVLVFIRTAHLI